MYITTILRGIIGMFVIILIAWFLSNNRKMINWKMVGIGLLIQFILAIGVLYVPFIQISFEFIGKLFIKTLGFAEEGTRFLFKSLITDKIEPPLITFAITILPTIVFFSALTSILYYLGIIQKAVHLIAKVFTKLLNLSGAESLSVIGNIFLGQSESPFMIKGYLDKMSKSEMLLVMSGGMATLAGGVLAIYIKVLGGGDAIQELYYAKHLMAASVMAAPGVVVVSKILFPQTESIEKDVIVNKEQVGKNVLDTISNGTYDGIKLAVNVGGMLIVFIALIAMLNFILQKIGSYTNLNDFIVAHTNGNYNTLSLQFILGYIFAPLMWLLGVPGQDIDLVGRVLGEKIILTEFIGYISLADLKDSDAFYSHKSITMATYMLCGFANFASVGIQIGGIGALVPKRKVLLSQLGMKALIAGTLASLLSAAIVGILWH